VCDLVVDATRASADLCPGGDEEAATREDAPLETPGLGIRIASELAWFTASRSPD